MNVKKAFLISYYAVMIGFLGTKVIDVVYQGGMIIAQGSQAQALQVHQADLVQEKYQLQQQLSQSSALHSIAQSEMLSQYEPITQPIVLELPSTVASR